jgi:hypothetical protein
MRVRFSAAPAEGDSVSDFIITRRRPSLVPDRQAQLGGVYSLLKYF